MKQDRQQLVTQANAAETPDQIKVATVALKRWQASNPNDPEINTARTISYEGGLAQDKARMVIGPRLLFGLKLYLFQKRPFSEHIARLDTPLQIGLYMPYSLGEMYQKRLSFGTPFRARRYIASKVCARTAANMYSAPLDLVGSLPCQTGYLEAIRTGAIEFLCRNLDTSFREFLFVGSS